MLVLLGLKIKNRNKIQETTREEEATYRWVLLIIQILNNTLIFIPNLIKINKNKKKIIIKWPNKHNHDRKKRRLGIYN